MLLLESTVHRSTFVGVLKCGSPNWARTSDTWINSPSLYQLSYWGINLLHELVSSQSLMWLPKLCSRNQQRHMLLLESTVHYSTFVVVLKCGSPNWARTSDTWINSPSLYQLSYWGIAYFR